MVAVDRKDGQGDWVCLCWTTVDEADAYRIWREVYVITGVDEAGNLVELDSPRSVWMQWGEVTRPEDQGPILCAVIAALDGDATRLAVSSVQDEVDSERTVEGDTATAVRRLGWGAVKDPLRAAAARDWRRH